MIIECQTCHARFRLDESRIKGRGARVKCRKCGDSIVVLKDGGSGPAPSAPTGEGVFDLGSAVRDSVAEDPVSPPPAGNLIPFPAPSRAPEPTAPGSSTPAQEAAEGGKDEVDLAFDRFLLGGTEASFPSIGTSEAEVPPTVRESTPVTSDAPSGQEHRPETDLGALTLDLGPEKKLDLPLAAEPKPPFGEPPAAKPKPPFGEPPAAEPAAEFRGEGGFLISDSDTLDFLREKHPKAEAEPSPGIGDISLEISSTPADGTSPFLRELETSPARSEDRASPSPAGNFLEGNATPPSPTAIDVPPYREAEPPPAPSAESPVRRGPPAPESRRQRSSVGPVVAAVLAVLLAAGGYLGLTTPGRKTLERAVPGIAALWGGNPSSPAAAKYDLRNVIGYYESSAASPRILVIKGQVANLSAVEKSGIRVHAALLDNTDAVLVQQAVYAGNVLSGDAIRKGDRDSLAKALGNRFGEGLANMHIAPGKAIPFMVLFFDAPANIDSYKLEAKDGE